MLLRTGIILSHRNLLRMTSKAAGGVGSIFVHYAAHCKPVRTLRSVVSSKKMSRKILFLLSGGLLLLGGSYALQREFREYPGVEYEQFPLPPDYREKTEWVFARLMYPPSSGGRRFGFRYGSDWTQGASSWTTDYPRSDR